MRADTNTFNFVTGFTKPGGIDDSNGIPSMWICSRSTSRVVPAYRLRLLLHGPPARSAGSIYRVRTSRNHHFHPFAQQTTLTTSARTASRSAITSLSWASILRRRGNRSLHPGNQLPLRRKWQVGEGFHQMVDPCGECALQQFSAERAACSELASIRSAIARPGLSRVYRSEMRVRKTHQGGNPQAGNGQNAF